MVQITSSLQILEELELNTSDMSPPNIVPISALSSTSCSPCFYGCTFSYEFFLPKGLQSVHTKVLSTLLHHLV